VLVGLTKQPGAHGIKKIDVGDVVIVNVKTMKDTNKYPIGQKTRLYTSKDNMSR
jgi:hypothetical protein